MPSNINQSRGAIAIPKLNSSRPITVSLYEHVVASPIGNLYVMVDLEGRVRALDFEDHTRRLHRLLREHYGEYRFTVAPADCIVEQKLRRYFAGDLTALDDVPVATNGTMLQRKIWGALRKIPVGSTVSYVTLATSLGLSGWAAAREVGQANASNPIAVIVPCHRIIGHNGDLKGFAGGLPRKRWLLAHEKVLPAVEDPTARHPQLSLLF
jgi:methylated-DNA-[protein]-cysteine S-methyltransferase